MIEDLQAWLNVGGWAAFALWSAVIHKKSMDKLSEAVNKINDNLMVHDAWEREMARKK